MCSLYFLYVDNYSSGKRLSRKVKKYKIEYLLIRGKEASAWSALDYTTCYLREIEVVELEIEETMGTTIVFVQDNEVGWVLFSMS